MTHRILIVEDEADIAEPMRIGLTDHGFYGEVVASVEAARRRLVDHWDLIILDLTLPELPGETLLNYLKQQPDYPAILVVTARSSIQDKLSLFRQGCDDYLTKPFIFDELLVRVRALLRRSQRVNTDAFGYEDLSLDPSTFRLSSRDESTILTPKEASILRVFLSSPGKLISRKEILENVWGLREEPETDFIGVHIFNLRKKLSDVRRESWLQTVRSNGFVLHKPEAN